MAATIKIKRSIYATVPSGLAQGELAYSGALNDGADASLGKLYIGSPGTTASLVIGGTFYTNLLSANNGTASASKAVLLDANFSVSGLGTVGATTFTGTVITGSTSVTGGNLRLSGNTVSSTDTNGNISLNPNGTGSILVYGGDAEQWSLPRAKGTDTWVLTSNGSGAATWKQPVSVMRFDNGAGSTSTVNLLDQTFTLFGGVGVDVAVSGQSATISISSSEGVVTVDGVQTLYNKSLADTSTQLVNGTKAAKISVTSIAPGSTETFALQGTGGTIAMTYNKLSAFTATTSAELASVITDTTGTGALVFATSPTLVTPNIGAATATSVNGLTITSSTGTLNIANGSTLTVNSPLTFTGTLNPSSVNFGAGSTGTVAYSTDNLSFFAPTTSAQLAGVITDETGTGTLVFSNNAVLVAPTLGNASATTINGVTITQSTATLTLASGSTFATSGGFSTTLTSTGATSVTLPTSGTLSTLSNVETLTNKTISTGSTYQGGVIQIAYGGTGSDNGSITGSGALTFAAGGTTNNVILDPSGTGTVDVSSARITSLADPTGAQDAATKNYVDSVAQGLDAKGSVRAATTANVDTSTGGLLTIDGVTLAEGDRVLVKNQTTTATNGIYIASSGAWARSSDMNQPAEFAGAFTFVEDGTTWADTGWVCTTNAPVTVGTTPITWVQFSSAGVITAGAGLTKTGNTLSVNVDNSSTAIVADNVVVKDKGVTYAKIQDVEALSVIGQSTTTTGTSAAITASSDHNILRRSGNTLAFGSIDLSQSGAVGTSILGVVNGGTGLATATTNGVVYGNGISAMGVTAAGTEHQVLRAGAGGVPSFGAVALNQGGTAVTGTLAVAHGGTGNASLTATQLLIGDGTNPVAQSANLTFAAAGTTGASELTVGNMKLASTGSKDVIITATASHGNIILAPNGNGIVDIGGPNSGSSSLGTTGNETLNITAGGALNLKAGTTMTLTTTASDIVMALPNTSTYKVSLGTVSAANYATGIEDNDLVTAYWVNNFSAIDGGTY